MGKGPEINCMLCRKVWHRKQRQINFEYRPI